MAFVTADYMLGLSQGESQAPSLTTSSQETETQFLEGFIIPHVLFDTADSVKELLSKKVKTLKTFLFRKTSIFD
jgi:hypothetical protein